MNPRATLSFARRNRQRGVVLIIALLVMVVTILAAVALVRTVDVATLVSGNLAYRQAAVQATDSGVEAARTWLLTQPIDNLNNNSGGTGYFATWDGGIAGPIMAFNPATFTWDNTNSAAVTDVPDTSTQVRYVVHRMCQNTGDPTVANCFTSQTITTGGNSNRIKEPGDLPCFDPNTGKNLCGIAANPYYRISIRVAGPRGTVSYAQAVVY